MTAVAEKTCSYPEAVEEWKRRRVSVWRTILRPPPKLTISEWADRYRYVPPESSPEPGPWRTDRVPYLRGIMDTLSERRVRKVVWMAASQLGKTELILNILGYYSDQEPSPILVVQPSERPMAEAFSKDRLAPMIRDTPVLANKVDSRSGTLLHKGFPGGHITMSGANSPSGLASRPIRILLCDEVDRYPASAGIEGDPLSLAVQRTENFTWTKKILEVSTPTITGLSRIESEWEQSDQRRFFVPCPECGHKQHLVWANVLWEKDELDGGKHAHRPEDGIWYACEGYGAAIQESSKTSMLRDGEWRATNPEGLFPGFHLNAIYSPWTRWLDLVQEWLAKHKNARQLQTFVNLRLGEPFDEARTLVEPDPLLKRRESYPTSPLPHGVLALTAGVDLQANRLEVEIVGWGLDFESWSLDYVQIPGDPTAPGAWKLLDHVIQKTYEHPLGVRLRVAATAVDSGHWAQEVYRYVLRRKAQQVMAVKGLKSSFGKPLMGRPWITKARKVPVFPVAVDEGKKLVYARLRTPRPDDWEGEASVPGYSHFPDRAPYDIEYFRQLTAEKLVQGETRDGYPTQRWVKMASRRNEALDVRVYATAALEALINGGLRLEQLAQQLRSPPTAPRKRAVVSKGVEV